MNCCDAAACVRPGQLWLAAASRAEAAAASVLLGAAWPGTRLRPFGYLSSILWNRSNSSIICYSTYTIRGNITQRLCCWVLWHVAACPRCRQAGRSSAQEVQHLPSLRCAKTIPSRVAYWQHPQLPLLLRFAGLVHLNLSGNRLARLPPAVAAASWLNYLDVSNNPGLDLFVQDIGMLSTLGSLKQLAASHVGSIEGVFAKHMAQRLPQVRFWLSAL